MDGKKIIGAEKSKNDGKAWKLISTNEIPTELSINDFWEPKVVEVSDNHLIALVRYNSRNESSGYLFQSESNNGGKSWSTLHKTPIWGFPAHLLKLSIGWILAVYGVRKPPFGERACISKDGGKTWDVENEITLSQSTNGDLGYPCSVQLKDGSIFTVYYQIDQPGEKTCLMATHWKLLSD